MGKRKHQAPSRGLKTPSPTRSEHVNTAAAKTRAAAARIRKETRADKADFQAAHRKGMDALRRHDYEAVAEAATEERAIIERRIAHGRRQKDVTPRPKNAAKKR